MHDRMAQYLHLCLRSMPARRKFDIQLRTKGAMMAKPLRIYLADLTYDTIALSTEVFPLNVGYIAAYCVGQFGGAVDISLFKYIDELDDAIHDAPPDVLALSNYCWNSRVGLELFRMAVDRNPNTITVWGGPNFPIDHPSRQQFLDRHVDVDVYVPVEGEIGFSNIVEYALGCRALSEAKVHARTTCIDGCITRHDDGEIQYSNPVRIKTLDDIPSPYLMGLMDKFFDGRLCPMIQTNRGCPFTCSFCVDGSKLVTKVHYFSLERVKEELQYIGRHVPSTTHTLEISDLNFGMYERDAEICEAIKEVQDKYDWPKHIIASTGKNKKERIVNALKTLNGSLRMAMSVQSTTQQVLKNVRRSNISLDAMIELAPALREAGLRSYSEVIVPLPGETYETHLRTIQDLIKADIDLIRCFTLMLLNGSELATPAERSKWGFVTKYRLLTMDFAKLSNGTKVLETEEVVVGTNTLSQDQYVDLRVLALVISLTNRAVAFDALIKFVKENGVDLFQLYFTQHQQIHSAPPQVAELIAAYRKATVSELWDSPQDLEAHYQCDAAYQKLLTGEEGVNLINYFSGVAVSECMDQWTDYTLTTARQLLRQREPAADVMHQFEDVANYCRGVTHNVMQHDRRETVPEFAFQYDIAKWLDDASGTTLGNFRHRAAIRLRFVLTDKQHQVVQDLLDLHGNTVAGRGQALRHVPISMLWRQPARPMLGITAAGIDKDASRVDAIII